MKLETSRLSFRKIELRKFNEINSISKNTTLLKIPSFRRFHRAKNAIIKNSSKVVIVKLNTVECRQLFAFH